jgi:predicted metal-dependent hydrolase
MGYMEVGSLKIQVVKKDIKNIHLSVYPPTGKVRLASPRDVKEDTLRLFVVSKIGWIRKQQRRFQNQEREGRREFIERESHYFLGRRYLLKVIERSAASEVAIKGKFIVMHVRPGTTKLQRKKILQSWYRARLKEQIEPLMQLWQNKIGVQASAWGIRIMKTKWGSCNTDSKSISFNLELAKKPVKCIEFVVVHELVHLVERRHSKRFVGLLDRVIPTWRISHYILNSNI